MSESWPKGKFYLNDREVSEEQFLDAMELLAELDAMLAGKGLLKRKEKKGWWAAFRSVVLGTTYNAIACFIWGGVVVQHELGVTTVCGVLFLAWHIHILKNPTQ